MEEDLKDIDVVLLTKYLSDETDASETFQVVQWATASPENKAILEKFQKAWTIATAGVGMQEWDVKKSKEQFLLKLIHYQSDNKTKSITFYETGWKIIRNVLTYAAVIMLLVGLPSLLVYRQFFMSPLGTFEGKALTEISAPKGSKTVMVLSDGSKVWLNAGSILKFGADFNKTTREVFLDGEAYFDVAKNKNKPFLVRTNKLTLRVLGTSFNVKSYSDEKTVETTLIKGSVKVEKSETDGTVSNYLLKPNQKAIFNKTDGDIKFYDLSDNKSVNKAVEEAPVSNLPMKTQNSIDQLSTLAEKDISWKDGYFLVFDETLESIMIKVERRFDLKIEFRNEAIKKLRYSGKIKESTPEQILEALKITSPIEYEIKGKEVIIWENPGRKEQFNKK